MSALIGFQKNGDKIREILPQSEQLSTELERRILFLISITIMLIMR